MTADLPAFLTARLDEDEAAARAAMAAAGDRVGDSQWTPLSFLSDVAARVLADVAAKRAIVAEWRTAQDEAERGDMSGKIAAFAFMLALQHLAQPYADRPGWDEGWRV